MFIELVLFISRPQLKPLPSVPERPSLQQQPQLGLGCFPKTRALGQGDAVQLLQVRSPGFLSCKKTFQFFHLCTVACCVCASRSDSPMCSWSLGSTCCWTMRRWSAASSWWSASIIPSASPGASSPRHRDTWSDTAFSSSGSSTWYQTGAPLQVIRAPHTERSQFRTKLQLSYLSVGQQFAVPS